MRDTAARCAFPFLGGLRTSPRFSRPYDLGATCDGSAAVPFELSV
jgi:hypothetical protein